MKYLGALIILFALNGLNKGVIIENTIWLIIGIALLAGGEVLSHTFLLVRKTLHDDRK
jgi:hypothetical protein